MSMTFIDYLKLKKGVDTDKVDPMDLMDEYYDEYKEYLLKTKDGCSPKES